MHLGNRDGIESETRMLHCPLLELMTQWLCRRAQSKCEDFDDNRRHDCLENGIVIYEVFAENVAPSVTRDTFCARRCCTIANTTASSAPPQSDQSDSLRYSIKR